MNFFNSKNKIQKSFEGSKKYDHELFVKKEPNKGELSPVSHIKVPKILYDTGWLSASTEQGDLNYSNITLTYDHSTALENQRVPFALDFSFTKEFEIPENFLPFIKSSISIKEPSESQEIKIEGVTVFDEYEYGDNYFRVKGDSTLIYQGTTPTLKYFPDTDRINGDFLTSLSSNWYRATFKVMVGADEWEVRNGIVDEIKTWWNVTESVVQPGASDWDLFHVKAHSGMSSTAVQGIGELEESRIIPDNGGSQQSITSTLNSTQTATLFETSGYKTGTTKVIFNGGSIYKNGTFQGSASAGYTMVVKGELWNEGTFRPSDKTGNIQGDSLVSFAPSRAYTGSISNFLYRLWWDTLKAREFIISTITYLLPNPPQTTDYETGTLPYTNLTVEVNLGDYPTPVEEGSPVYLVSSNQEIWTKVNTERYKYHLEGTIYLSALASLIGSEEDVDEVDETYSQSGNTYTRDAPNRGDKGMPIYLPEELDIQARLILSLNNPGDYSPENIKRIL